MSNSAERRLDALEALVRANSTALRRLPTVPDRKVVEYRPPALGTWLVTIINGTATEPVDPVTDWDSFFDDVANFDLRRRSALPTRVGELHAVLQARDSTVTGWVDPDHKRFFTAFDNLGPAYAAKLLLTFTSTGHVYVKHNGKGTDYTVGRNEITLDIQPGRNKVSIQAKTLASPSTGGGPTVIDFVSILQLEGVLFEPDQCIWRVGMPKGPFFSEILGDDDGGGGGGGGGGITPETGGGGGGIG